MTEGDWRAVHALLGCLLGALFVMLGLWLVDCYERKRR